jgi:hypothetical protein
VVVLGGFLDQWLVEFCLVPVHRDWSHVYVSSDQTRVPDKRCCRPRNDRVIAGAAAASRSLQIREPQLRPEQQKDKAVVEFLLQVSRSRRSTTPAQAKGSNGRNDLFAKLVRFGMKIEEVLVARKSQEGSDVRPTSMSTADPRARVRPSPL